MIKNRRKQKGFKPKQKGKKPGVAAIPERNIVKPLHVFLAFLFPVLLYVQTLSFEFTYYDDDQIIVDNYLLLKDSKNFLKPFLTDAFLDGTSHFYRPLQTLTYMIDIQFSGVEYPWMFHLSNILILGLTGLALYLLLVEFSIPTKIALFSALIYCAHPLFVSSIAWIPARGDLLLTFFSISSMLFLIKYLQNRKSGYLFFHLFAFTLALFSKETAAFLVALFLFYYYLFYFKRPYFKKDILILGLYGIIGIFWFLLRYRALYLINQVEFTGFMGQSEEVGLIPLLRNIRSYPEAISSFLLPFNIKQIPEFSTLRTISGVLIIGLLSIAFFRTEKPNRKELLFSFTWSVLLLVPTMLYKSEMIDYLNHRFFLSLVGILLLVLLMLPKQIFYRNHSPLNLFFVFILAGLSLVTFKKSRIYKNPVVFYESVIAERSTLGFALGNLGYLYLNQGSYDLAIDYSKRALQYDPELKTALNNLGYAYHNLGLFDLALENYNKAVSVDPKYAMAYH